MVMLAAFAVSLLQIGNVAATIGAGSQDMRATSPRGKAPFTSSELLKAIASLPGEEFLSIGFQACKSSGGEMLIYALDPKTGRRDAKRVWTFVAPKAGSRKTNTEKEAQKVGPTDRFAP